MREAWSDRVEEGECEGTVGRPPLPGFSFVNSSFMLRKSSGQISILPFREVDYVKRSGERPYSIRHDSGSGALVALSLSRLNDPFEYSFALWQVTPQFFGYT